MGLSTVSKPGIPQLATGTVCARQMGSVSAFMAMRARTAIRSSASTTAVTVEAAIKTQVYAAAIQGTRARLADTNSVLISVVATRMECVIETAVSVVATRVSLGQAVRELTHATPRKQSTVTGE